MLYIPRMMNRQSRGSKTCWHPLQQVATTLSRRDSGNYDDVFALPCSILKHKGGVSGVLLAMTVSGPFCCVIILRQLEEV
jgi:hypothetical protein